MNKMLLQLYQDSLRNLENGYVKNLTGLHERLKGLEDQFEILRDALSDDGKPSAQELYWGEPKRLRPEPSGTIDLGKAEVGN